MGLHLINLFTLASQTDYAMTFLMKDWLNPSKFPWLKGASCIVTGGAGFIGSNLCMALVKIGAKVIVIDDLSSGFKENLSGLNIELVEKSITDNDSLENTFKGKDYVFHLAAIPAVSRSVEKPIETAWANIWGTQLVLENARLANVKKVIYSSSSSAYGSTTGENPRSESLPPLPLSPYAAQKLSGEYLTRVYALTLGLDTVSLRYFNIFGPKQNPTSTYAAVIPKFITLALEDKSIPLHGNGDQSRDFTYVENALYANLLASNPEVKTQGEVINIGCGENFSLNTLIDEIRKLCGKNELRVEKLQTRAGDVLFSKADISKAKSLIGYSPVINFADGLQKTFSFLTQPQ
jgi:nucleoside-diphosphate-sugar epimerase